MFKRVILLCWLISSVLLAVLAEGARAQEGSPLVLVLTADGPVTPAMREYLSRGIRVAEREGAEVLVFELNTPGGSVSVMNEMVQDIRGSSIPVVVYVAPRGAMAASAGTIITLAGHASAMAPETIIGAASPVGSQGEDLGQTMAAKEKNALTATIQTLMEGRSPQAVDLAKQTVENAQAVSAKQALDIGMVDFMATNLDDLLQQLDSFTVNVVGSQLVLHTANARVQPLPLSFIEQLLLMLTNPNIVFLLLTIGVQAILIELAQPGGWVAGFLGVVCLALAIYGLGILPVNYFGLVFLATAFVLFVLDVKAPTHGALTVAGIGSLIVGALVLFNSPSTPSFQRVSVPLVIGTSIITALIFAVILSFVIRAQRNPVRTGQEVLMGQVGVVRSDLDPQGMVHVNGEMWSAELAEGTTPLPKGRRVVVVGIRGLRLRVRQADSQSADSSLPQTGP